MSYLLNRIRSLTEKRARYLRTVAELRRLPVNVALDLDIYPGDAKQIARRAVYGTHGAA